MAAGTSIMKRLSATLLAALLLTLSGCKEEPPPDSPSGDSGAAKSATALAVVKGTRTAKAFPAEAGAVRTCHARVGTCLDAADLPWESLTDEDVSEGRLSAFSLAIFPYNAKLTTAEVEAIGEFVQAGGKLVWFYGPDPRVASLLGIEVGQLHRADYEGQFHKVRFTPSAPEGVPDAITQDSWHMLDVQPAEGTEVIAHWQDSQGRDTGLPAVTRNANGVWFSHVLLGGGLKDKGQMLLALLGHFQPALWSVSASTALDRACAVSSLSSFEELSQFVESGRETVSGYPHAKNSLRVAQGIRDKALAHAEAKRFREALAEAKRARSHALRAYEYAQPSRDSEFRGVWIHSAYGVSDWGWQRSLRVLADNGFNAVLPNMCWAGKADYYSSILPVTHKARERGDQLAECVKWARRYGVQVHVWKVNYNLDTAPNSLVGQLRKEGRLQKGRNGRELRRKWLCPSNQANIDLERNSLLEVVRKYKVDGIHLDYIRYPGFEGCYCENCQSEFEKRIGRALDNWPSAVDAEELRDKWQQFRRDQITRLVRAVRQGLDRMHSSAKLSAAVYGSWEPARGGIAQDAKAWVDEGLVDFLCPMNYTNSLRLQEQLTTEQMQAVYGRLPLYPGIGYYSAQSKFTSTDQLIDQIQLVRRAGADGFVVFQYRSGLADPFLPALRRGVTSSQAVAPHDAPRFTCRLSGKSPAFEAPTFKAGAPVTAHIGQPQSNAGVATVAVDRVDFVRLDDSVVVDFKPQLTPGSSQVFSITPAEGRYRFAIRGTHEPSGSSPKPFVWKSRVVHVAHHAVVEAQEWKDRPPPKGKGLHVGIWQDGFGSTGIFTCLRRDNELLPFYIRDLAPETLKQCRAVVLAQPRDAASLAPGWPGALRQWVERGGRLLLTHDACGYRQLPALFPELWKVASYQKNDKVHVAGTGHALTEGIDPEAPFEHSYYDHLILDVLHDSVAMAVVDGDGRPVVVTAEVGRGKVVACGLAVGLDADDEDVEPATAEAALLRNAVGWLLDKTSGR